MCKYMKAFIDKFCKYVYLIASLFETPHLLQLFRSTTQNLSYET